MNDSNIEYHVEEQMLNATELFHYSYRFRNAIFCIAVPDSLLLGELLPDLRVLQTSRIKTALVMNYSEELVQRLGRLSERGHSFEPFILEDASQLQKRKLNGVFLSGAIPVLLFRDVGSPKARLLHDFAFAAADVLNARKIFFAGKHRGIELDGQLLSHPTQSELESIITSSHKVNLDKDLLEYLIGQQKKIGVDLILLEARTGVLFREIFTHRGAGTLVTSDFPNIIRKAIPSDVAEISLLLKPYIKTGQMLPVSEREIYDSLDNYYVFTVNGQVLASAKLSHYGEAGEIGKICTLPRYQRRGRARLLTLELIARARKDKLCYVFSLTTQQQMAEFFESLGFKEVSRETLPDQWKKGYDFGRPSRAFKLDL